MDSPTVSPVMTQYHGSKGLKIFGKQGLAAVDTELRELVMRDVMQHLKPDNMKQNEQR